MSDSADSWLAGKRVAMIGRLAGMTKRDFLTALRDRGAQWVPDFDPTQDRSPHSMTGADIDPFDDASLPDLVIVADDALLDDEFAAALDQCVAASGMELVREAQLWEHLGMVDPRLYTPAMLAELLNLPLATIRRWQRHGLITPVREVRRLPYFDFQQVAWARRIAEMMARGMTPAAIEKKLRRLAEHVPGVDRQVAQLSVIVEGRDILMRRGEGLIDARGQMRIDFDAPGDADTIAMHGFHEHGASGAHGAASAATFGDELLPSVTDAGALLSRAAALEDEGELELAVDLYHAVMALTGPTAEVCFQLAEALYRLGRVDGAMERYFVAIELDEDFVEARANLGCVLLELGRVDLAIAAFRGALDLHPEYPDVHYHLAQALDALGAGGDAEEHWCRFLDLAPDSPWAAEAEERLGIT